MDRSSQVVFGFSCGAGRCTDCGSDTTKCYELGVGGEAYRRFKDSHTWPRRFFIITNGGPPYCSEKPPWNTIPLYPIIFLVEFGENGSIENSHFSASIRDPLTMVQRN